MSKTLFFILAITLCLSFSSALTYHMEFTEELKPLWASWKTINSKEYSVAEEAARFAIFVENYKKVRDFNAENDDVKLALNKFADLTGEEFKIFHTGAYTPSEVKPALPLEDQIDFGLMDLPTTVDWREKGAVTIVKNQQQCGSCWVFSATGALESLYFIKHQLLLTFSEQQVVDCDSTSQGCNGGFPLNAFAYTAKYGIETEKDYPYTGEDGTCHYDKSKAIAVNTGSQAVTPKNLDAMKTALVIQPVSVSIEADQQIFQFYKSGVIKGAKCGANLDHAVLVVGYTVMNSEEAFIVKNSWGPDWGASGYVFISTNGSVNSGTGVCGILSDPVVPTD